MPLELPPPITFPGDAAVEVLALLITFMTSSFIVDGSSDSISVVVDKYLSLLVIAAAD